MLQKISALLVLLYIFFVPLNAGASDEKGWYPFLQNKGWYEWGGQSSSTSSSSSTGSKEEPLIQPTTQPGISSSQPMANASSQTGNQQTQPSQSQSSWFK